MRGHFPHRTLRSRTTSTRIYMSFVGILQIIGGVIAGGVIGLAFGQLQQIASRKHATLESKGQFNSGWAIMPGSFRRTGFLIIALVLIQMLCPLLFTNGAQWSVSAGVLVGYGYLLWRQLRRRLSTGS